MYKLKEIWRRVQFARRGEQHERELEEEILFHIEMRTQENLASGMSGQEARLEALRRFGNRTLIKQESREVWVFATMERFVQDLRYATRLLVKNPGFTLVAVISLALGIGANSTIYSIISAVLLRPVPVEQPDRLAVLTTRSLSYPAYIDFRDQSRLLSGVAAYSVERFSLNVGGRTELISGSFTTANFFDVLGVRAALGRTFLPEENSTPATHPVAVISHSLWQRGYGGAADVVGKTLTLNNYPLTIIGVAPKGFRGINLTRSPEVWVPIQMLEPLATGELTRLKPDMRGWGWLAAFGRLKDDVGFEQAQTEISSIVNAIKEAYPDLTPRNFSVQLTPVVTAATGVRSRASVVRFISILAAVVGIVLLIACANVANLMLARASQRRKEIAVRLALGASRSRIVRQLLTESVLLATLGGALGGFLALWAMDLLMIYELPGQIAITGLGLGLNREVFLFTLLTSFVTGIVFGLIPALQATRPDLVSALKDQGMPGAGGRSRLRDMLLAMQVALCLVLLIGAGLFVRSLQAALAIDPGFETEKTAFLSVNLGLQRYTEAQAESFYNDSIKRIESLPGVEAASWTSSPQLASLAPYMLFVSYEGYDPGDNERPEAEFNYISEGYFQAMGIEVVRGRAFNETDAQGAPRVAVINERLGRRYFPDADPIGQSIRVAGQTIAIIGIVRDSKYHSLNEETPAYIYVPLKQNIPMVGLETLSLIVRAKGDSRATLSNAAREIQAMDPDLPISEIKTMREHIGNALMAQRFGSTLLGLFSLLTLVLASVGIYGVVAYLVGMRTREIGIRMALGANGRTIMRLMLANGLLPVGVGIGAGIGAAALLARTTSAFLYGVSATDPVTFVVAALTLATAALLAGYVPARRATKVDPMIALRYE